MRVIPVLDLRRGQAVHARGGLRASYVPLVSGLAPDAAAGDAGAIAAAYGGVLGVPAVYVADLDAIGGGQPQWPVVQQVAERGLGVWIDAGIATAALARTWASMAGIERVVVGLETLPSTAALGEIVRAVGADRVMFSLDLRDGALLSRAPELRRGTPEDAAAAAAAAGVASIIVLDVARVGMGVGVDETLVARLVRSVPGVELIVGGGVRDGGDLRRLAALGVNGALVGSAVHDGRVGRRELERAGG